MKFKNFPTLFTAVIFLIFSFTYFFLPLNGSFILLYHVSFLIGNILILNLLSKNLNNFSLFRFTDKISAMLIKLLIYSLMFRAVMEFYGLFIAHFWYYRYWNFTFFLITFVPIALIYGAYSICLYTGGKAIFTYLLKNKFHIRTTNSVLKIPVVLGILGAIAFIYGTFFVLGSKWTTLSTKINIPIKTSIPIPYYFIIFALLIFIFEIIEQRVQKTSLLSETLHGNFYPIFVLVISSWIIGTPYEYFNVGGWLWIYTNVPFGQIIFYHVPLVVLVFWPLQGLMALYPYRILFKNESKDLWSF